MHGKISPESVYARVRHSNENKSMSEKDQDVTILSAKLKQMAEKIAVLIYKVASNSIVQLPEHFGTTTVNLGEKNKERFEKMKQLFS